MTPVFLERSRHEFPDRRGRTLVRAVERWTGRVEVEVHVLPAWDDAAPADREAAAAWVGRFYPRLTHDQRFQMLSLGRPGTGRDTS